MAEEFQTAGICGEAWWVNPARSSSSSLSPCLAAGFGLSDHHHHHHHMGTFLWSSNDQHMLDLKTTAATTTATTTMKSSCEESNHNTNSVSADSSSMLFNNQKPQTDSDSGGGSSILMDSTLQMMSFPPPSTTSSTSDWNHSLLLGGHGGGDHQNNYRSMMTEDLNTQIEKEWSPKSFSCSDNNCNAVMTTNSSQGLSAGFPVNSASYGYTSGLLQTYFEPEPEPAVQQSLYGNQPLMTNYMPNDHNWPKFAAPFSKPKQQQQEHLQQQPISSSTGLHFSNNTPFWNASSPLNEARPPSFLPNLQYKHDRNFLAGGGIAEKRNCPTFATKYNNNEEVRDSVSAAKKVSSTEPAPFKRPRIETPSPLPTFKVRKEKLGDRITALQQLVSPFGKTDTASVLHEAIDYIKFLHDQVSVLTTPYMKQGTQISQQQSCDHHNKLKDPEASKQDLKTRGLCLVPISSTFPVANETTADFWTPTFGGTFR